MKVLFEKNYLVKFSDTDPQGILHYPRAFEIAHTCLEEFWSMTEFGWDYWFKNPEFAVPIRHADAEFFQPMKAGERYSARLIVGEFGESSVKLICEFADGDSSASEADIACARVSSVHVFVDRSAFKKIPVPQTVRELLS